MTGTVLIIFTAVLAGVLALGAVTRIMEGPPPGWKRLAARYPADASVPGSGNSEMRLLVCDAIAGAEPRVRIGPKALTVRYRSDEDAIQMVPVSIRGGAALGASVPWAAIQIGEPMRTRMGPHIGLLIDDVALLIPQAAIEQEIALRAHMAPQHDPLVEEIR